MLVLRQQQVEMLPRCRETPDDRIHQRTPFRGLLTSIFKMLQLKFKAFEHECA